MKRIVATLRIETHGVDDAAGTRKGSLHRAFVMRVRDDRLNADVFSRPLMPDARKRPATRRPIQPVPPNTVTQLIARSVKSSFAVLLIDPSSAVRTVST